MSDDATAVTLKTGDKFALSCRVDTKVYELFRDVFEDRNPLHMDADFARGKGFDGPVMHGNILGGFLSRLIGEVLPAKNVIIQSQTIDFRRPVYLNDELDLSAVVDETFESVNTASLSFKFTNAGGVRVASGTILIGFLP